MFFSYIYELMKFIELTLIYWFNLLLIYFPNLRVSGIFKKKERKLRVINISIMRKINYILIIIGLVIIITGLCLMSGEGTTETSFNPDIFSPRRIKVAPMVCLFGFLFEILACLKTK